MTNRIHPRDLIDALLVVYILLVVVAALLGHSDAPATVIAIVMAVAIVGGRVQMWRQDRKL